MKETKDFYIGDYAQDAMQDDNKGWILGSFKTGVRKTEDVEIKYWQFEKNIPTNHPRKVSSIIECTIILEGEVQGSIGDKEIILKAGDYVVIKPGVSNNLIERVLSEKVAGFTVKAPSDTTAKKVITEDEHERD